MGSFSKFVAIAGLFMLPACAHAVTPACTTSPSDKAEIDRTVRGLFDALGKEDRVAFGRLTTASFYSFDVGKRFSGSELLDAVRDAHARGVELNWSIGPLDTHLGCDMAWAAWENSGSAGIPPKVQPVRWLESAMLVRRDGAWKVDFFHSTRAAVGQ